MGSIIDVLQALEGKSYTNVEIRKAAAIGISIRHESGAIRGSFENLPHAMQMRFTF